MMYRNFHGSGEVDAEFDDICKGASGTQYRITVNSTEKILQGERLRQNLEIYYIWGNRV